MGPQLHRCGKALTADGEPIPVQLQWGRNFIVAERVARLARALVEVYASMGPQLHRCGKLLPAACVRGGPPGFNGAATSSLRKEDTAADGVLVRAAASMGPQLHRCGKLIPLVMALIIIGALQWGRNFIVAERLNLVSWFFITSMLQWGRNFIVAESGVARPPIGPLLWASMGPQLHRCGKP